jgi:ATP-dependent DNA helicase RecQ
VPAYIIFNDRTLIEMAENRPQTLDDMARVSGVGAKKLETYGATFLSVITGTTEDLHPKRMKLAGRGGDLYDRLMEVQRDLHHGPDGTEKPLSCSASTIAKLVELKPGNAAALERILGDRKAERFGAAFLDAIAEAS